MTRLVEAIEWHVTAAKLPDADTTVLVICPGDFECSVGFLDGDPWRNYDAMPIPDPLFWAELPTGPTPP
jgi:hypothetical protein